MTTIAEIKPGQWAVVEPIASPAAWKVIPDIKCWRVISPLYATSMEARLAQARIIMSQPHTITDGD